MTDFCSPQTSCPTVQDLHTLRYVTAPKVRELFVLHLHLSTYVLLLLLLLFSFVEISGKINLGYLSRFYVIIIALLMMVFSAFVTALCQIMVEIYTRFKFGK